MDETTKYCSLVPRLFLVLRTEEMSLGTRLQVPWVHDIISVDLFAKTKTFEVVAGLQ